MPEVPDKAAWERLGKLLERRRVTMDPRYSNLSLFCQERGINYRMAWDAEQAQRTNFRSATRLAIDIAYGWEPGSTDEVLAGAQPRLAEDKPRVERLSDVQPECAFERNVIQTPGASDESKLEMIVGHRSAGHQPWCRDQADAALDAAVKPVASLPA